MGHGKKCIQTQNLKLENQLNETNYLYMYKQNLLIY